MAEVNKVVYDGKTLIDLTEDTVDAEHLSEGYIAHDKAGNRIVGLGTVTDDAVTVENGGVIEMTESLGTGPYVFEYTEDGEGSGVEASQVSYDNLASGFTGNTVQGVLDELGTNKTTVDNALKMLDASKADVTQLSNPNLLDNWYFVDPINQRGKTEYTGARYMYTIDRWYIAPEQKLSIENDGVRLVSIDSSDGHVVQRLEDPKRYKGVYTLSALISDMDSGASGGVRFVVFGPNNVLFDSHKLIENPGVVSYTIDFSQFVDITAIELRLSYTTPGKSVKYTAAKLEQGPVQTLAHQDADGNWVLNDPPPNKTTELLKCQRYFYVINEGEGSAGRDISTVVSNSLGIAYFSIPIPVVMRANPSINAIGSLRVHGVGVEYTNVSISASYAEGNIMWVVISGVSAMTPLSLDFYPSGQLLIDADL